MTNAIYQSSNNTYSNGNSNNFNQRLEVTRGDIFEVELGSGVGSEQQNSRPCVIIQNNRGNQCSPTVIIAIITSRTNKAKMPTHVEIPKDNLNNLNYDSVITLEQVRTVDKRRLKMKIGRCSDEIIEKINEAALVSIGIKQPERRESQDTYRKPNNYPVPQRFQQEAFDFTKAKRIARTVNELERTIMKYKLTNAKVDLYELKNDIKEYIIELKNYCNKFGRDYNVFYTPVSDVSVGYRKGDGSIVRAI